MITGIYSMATDSELTSHLKGLFGEYVALYTKLYNNGGENAGLPDERVEMAIKLECAIQEMSELVSQLQTLQSDSELAANVMPQTINPKKGNPEKLTGLGA
jgi:hypothetical protein